MIVYVQFLRSINVHFQALSDAWVDACASPTPSQLLVPKGRFCLNVIEFKGPCKAPIEIKIDGMLIGPEDPSVIPKGVQWITFSYIIGLTVSGTKTYYYLHNSSSTM